MKKIYWILLALIGAGMSFTACNEEEPFSTATADDEPRIIAPTFPELENNGNMKTFMELDRDKLLSITVTTTPADYTSVVWYLDGIEVGTEKTLEMNLNTGTYNLKVVVSTPSGKSTSRETLIKIKPLGEDPQSEEKVSERLVSAGGYATISGTNLDKVKKITLQRINVAESKSDSESSVIEIPGSDITPSSTSVSFRLPDNIAAGTYRVTLIDAEGNEFGANTIEVTQGALVKALSGNNRPNTERTLTGMNLNQIASLTIGGETINTFIIQTSNTLIFTCPNLDDGVYKLSGKTKDGESLKFLVEENLVEEIDVQIETSVVVTTLPRKLTPGNSFKLTGQNLDLISTLSLDGQNIVIIEKSFESITCQCPDLEDYREYILSGKDNNGRNVKFKTQEGDLDNIKILVRGVVETEMWSGHYYVSWEPGASESAKEFGEVKTMIQDLPIGSKLKIYYTIEPNDTYHQIGTKTAYWTDLPGYPESIFSEDGVVEIVLTQEIIDLLKAEAGFICVGHGYYVDRVTYEE